jgi:hypothetical protein
VRVSRAGRIFPFESGLDLTGVFQAFPVDDFHDSYRLEQKIPGQSVRSQDDKNPYELADIHFKASRESPSIQETGWQKGSNRQLVASQHYIMMIAENLA